MLTGQRIERLVGRSGRSPLGSANMSEFLRRIADCADADAFQVLFEAYAPRVKAYMMRQGADPATAEELAQETLLTVWRKANLYSARKGSEANWIFTIARNLRIDRLRREQIWMPMPQGREEEASLEQPADELLAETERRGRVRDALSALPPQYYEVVALSYIEGLSHSEIADRLSLPIGTVKSRMRAAYRAIRDAVEDLT